MARPPKGPSIVDSIEGNDFARERLRAVLETVAGTSTIKQVCERLGICEARFHVLRRQALETAMSDLAPKDVGRPPSPALSAEAQRIAALEHEVERLKLELEASQIRQELAVALPGRFGAQKKTAVKPKKHPTREARRKAERAERKAARKRR